MKHSFTEGKRVMNFEVLKKDNLKKYIIIGVAPKFDTCKPKKLIQVR